MRTLRTAMLPPMNGNPQSARTSMMMQKSANTRVRATSSRNIASTGELAVRATVPGAVVPDDSLRGRRSTVSARGWWWMIGGAGWSGGGVGAIAVGAIAAGEYAPL